MEVYAARDETRPRPWPSFRDRYGCEFPGKGVEQVLQYSSDSVSAINGVVKLQILNSYGNLWPFTVGIIDHSMCIDMELRCWNEVVRFLKHWRFASECVQSTSERKLSSICFIASESVNRLGTGVHVHGSATFLLWRLLLISLAAPSTFLNLALIPDELVCVLGMYMAGLHGLLSVDEHQPSACPDATVYCVQQSTAIFEAVLRPERYRAGFSLQYSVLGVAVKVFWTSVAPCCLMVNILAEKPNNMVIMASWESGYKSFITPFLTWKSVACTLNSVALIKWKVAWPLYDLPIYCSVALIGLHVPANLITPGWIYETLKDHSYMSGLQKFRDGICIGTTICACCLAWISEQKERIPYVFVVQEQCEPKLRSDHEREELLGIDFFTWSDLGVLNQSSWCALKPWSPLVLEISSLAIAGYGGLLLSWTEAMVSYLHCSFTTPDVFSRQHHWQIACSSQVNISAKGFDMPLHQPVTVIGPVCKMMSRGVQPFAGQDKATISSSCLQWDTGGICKAATKLGCRRVMFKQDVPTHTKAKLGDVASQSLRLQIVDLERSSPGGGNVMTRANCYLYFTSHHYYCDTFLDKILGYNYCINQVYYLDRVCNDLIYYHEDYHRCPLKIKEVHAPWDPGKSSLQIPFEDLGLGTSRFLRREECHDPCLFTRSQTVIWASDDGLGPTDQRRANQATYGRQETTKESSDWITKLRLLCSPSLCSSRLLPLATFFSDSSPLAACISSSAT